MFSLHQFELLQSKLKSLIEKSKLNYYARLSKKLLDPMTSPKSYWSILKVILKVGPSPSKKNCFICFIESPLNIMKNAFYFILKAFFVLKIFKFLSRLFGHVEKTA